MATPRFADRPAILLAGLRQYHRFEAASTWIPEQWARFNQGPQPVHRVGMHAFGAVCRSDAEGFEYMCAHEVSTLEDQDANMGRMIVPAQHYAVFTHEGHISGIKQTWDDIWRWLPASGFTGAPTPDFELYDERYDPATGRGVVEIWVPIRGKQVQS